MTVIKICGLTREEDVTRAVALGADMLGFIHVPGTPRFVDIPRLRALLPLGGEARRVIVVQDAAAEQLDRLRAELTFDLFQFHGEEPPEHLTRWGGYKVFHMRRTAPDPEAMARYGSPILLDTQVGSSKGGTGKTFDWAVLPSLRGELLVAGGLNPDNVGTLVRQYRPWGVDISSGVEAAPGVKDHEKLKQFIENTRSVSAA